MPATLRLVHKAIGAEVRRGTYDVMVDGKPAGSVEMNEAIDIPVEPGRHLLQVRNGRNTSRTNNDVAEDEVVAFAAPGRASCRSFSCPSSFPAWHFRSVASSPPCASPPPSSEAGAQAQGMARSIGMASTSFPARFRAVLGLMACLKRWRPRRAAGPAVRPSGQVPRERLAAPPTCTPASVGHAAGHRSQPRIACHAATGRRECVQIFQ